MIKASSLYEKVARYLTDFDSTDAAYQHVEWSRADLRDYFRLAVLMVRAAAPDSITCRKEMELVGETLMDLPEGCDDLLKVLGFMDSTGKLHTNVRVIKEDSDVFVSSRPVCAAGRIPASSITVKVDAVAGDVITVEPEGTRGKLILSCSCSPDMEDEDAEVAMSGKYEPVVFWWMVSMAFGTDIESTPMRERSDQYWNRGVVLMRMLNSKAVIPQRGGDQ